MIPEPNPTAVLSDMAAETFRASYRRGRMLVLAAVLITGASFFATSLQGYFDGAKPAKLSDLIGSIALGGFVCWCVFRGGRISSGCLIVLCAPVLPALVLGMLSLVSNLLIPGAHSSVMLGGTSRSFTEIGKDWQSTVGFLPYGLGAGYTFWVLVFSKDAHLYMRVRRKEVAEAEASLSAWPPPARRQEHSNDAP